MKVTKDKKYNFKKIVPDRGKVLTSWDKKDIKEYTSSTLMYTPMSFDETSLYELTTAEDKKNKEEQKAAYEAEHKIKVEEL